MNIKFVLNLQIAMWTHFVLLVSIILQWLGQISAPTPQPVSISSPVPGQPLQGQILIVGTTDVPGFQMAELWYSYQGGFGSFIINQQRESVRNGQLGIWDTTTINDGNYDLHLKVFLADGSVLEYSVPGLRVRNSSPIETNTPEIEITGAVNTPTPLHPTATMRPTATGLPTNPAAISQQDLTIGVIAGSVFVVGFFFLFGLYLGARKLMRRP